MIGIGPEPPGYWMHETSGVLRPAVEAYLNGEELTSFQVVYLRAYLRQWINSPMWQGEAVDTLRSWVNELRDRQSISRWLLVAGEEGIDPL